MAGATGGTGQYGVGGLIDEVTRCAIHVGLFRRSGRLPGTREVPFALGADTVGLVDQAAPDVYCLGPRGRTQTNVYSVRSGGSLVLIDAGCTMPSGSSGRSPSCAEHTSGQSRSC
ncbi:MAG: hypothetical protein WCF04_00115 [Candidatus Nanopelagicales bacterium]